MFGNLGVHVMQFPSGKWGFRGTLPTSLAEAVPATRDDIYGGRAFTAKDGSTKTWRFPVFDGWEDAVEFASSCGVYASCKEADEQAASLEHMAEMRAEGE